MVAILIEVLCDSAETRESRQLSKQADSKVPSAVAPHVWHFRRRTKRVATSDLVHPLRLVVSRESTGVVGLLVLRRDVGKNV